jgi:predicted regulator of Ras-like GTPase activity (Roadblock/LC7/MglB family)
LFGDLGPARGSGNRPRSADTPDLGFAATSIMESVATQVNARGQMVDRHSQDLVVSGSPAQAIREHFASTRADLDRATSLITLLDPAGVWASAVIKALSDAGGRPIERLHLREHTTLRTLATIERTTLDRRHEDGLRVYHADVRAPGSDNAEIPIALMERSQMTTVIIGPLQPHHIDALLSSLHAATSLPTWRCPNLLFMLPPNAVWIGNKISAVAWPPPLRVYQLSESMTGASTVWNAMLGMWNKIKSEASTHVADDATPPANEFAIEVGELAAPITRVDLDLNADVSPWFVAPDGAQARPPTPGASGKAVVFDGPPAPAWDLGAASPGWQLGSQAPTRVHRRALDPSTAKQAMTGLLGMDGLLGCAVVDATTGLAIARETREDHPVDMDLVAATCTQVLRAHRFSARGMGLSDQLDELMSSAGPRQQIMRILSRYPDLFIVVLLDKHRTNLTLARYQLLEVERSLP